MDASESERAQRRTPTPTPPSEAVGESGDEEARRAADEVVVGEGRTGGDGGGSAGHSGSGSGQRRRPGTGREAHVRQAPEPDDGGAPPIRGRH